MKKVILDTNFLMIPFSLKVDIFSELNRIIDEKFRICIIDRTIDELNGILVNGNGNEKSSAKFALDLINKKKIKIIECKGNYVDDAIVMEVNYGDYVATQDGNLKKRLKEKGIKIIILRQKKFLMIA